MAQTKPKSVLKATSRAELSTEDKGSISQRTGVLTRPQNSFSSNHVLFCPHISDEQPPFPQAKVAADKSVQKSAIPIVIHGMCPIYQMFYLLQYKK